MVIWESFCNIIEMPFGYISTYIYRMLGLEKNKDRRREIEQPPFSFFWIKNLLYLLLQIFNKFCIPLYIYIYIFLDGLDLHMHDD